MHVAKPVHRLGDERVLSVDLDTSPVDLARKFLAMISRDPLLEQASEPVLLRRDARTVSNGDVAGDRARAHPAVAGGRGSAPGVAICR